MAVLHIRNSSGEFEEVQSLNGKTAYQAAKEGGYTGTESEFNTKLAQPEYSLPIAAESRLGGVKPVTKSSNMTRAVGVDESGGLWTQPIELDATLTQAGQAADAAKTGEAISQLKDDIDDVEDNFAESLEDDNSTLFIIDSQGNIIATIGANGIESVNIDSDNKSNVDNATETVENMSGVSDRNEDILYITDSNGYIVAQIDGNGLTAINLAQNPYAGKKLVTLGDSMTAQSYIGDRASIWQSKLANLLGMVYDDEETTKGKNGHDPMAIGGTAIMPSSSDSIYIRAWSAKYYNPDVLIVYAGQNDRIYPSSANGDADGLIDETILGTINDIPYVGVTEAQTSLGPSACSFYSRYMGMIENLLNDNPNTLIVLVTLMRCRVTYDDTVTQSSARTGMDITRGSKATAVKEIAKKYSLPCVNLWDESGLNYLNNIDYYREDGNTQVHQNSLGNDVIARCIYKTLI